MMQFSPKAIKKATEIIDKRREKAYDAYEANKKTAYELSPRLAEIDRILSSSGIMIAKGALSSDFDAKINEIKQRNASLNKEKEDILSSLGFEKDYISLKYFCKKCNDTGFVNAMPCECLCDIINDLPEEQPFTSLFDCSFDNFDLSFYPDTLNNIECKKIMTQILSNCEKYCKEFSKESPNLLLYGGTGIGKTHISLSIANEVIKKGKNVVYISSPDLFSSLEKERFEDFKPKYSLNDYLKCDLLIIDDLGSEFITTFTTSALYNIINTRLNFSLPTIISSNLMPTEIKQKYTDRIASRILGCYEHLRFIGNDIRILKKKAK